ncbi:MAG TPA: ankyrin repeat domain-containing protein [Candidatus Methylomirabilis sp.]|nr:ankyrin repeat domain-containing protein [Candidatus Methylomirabilis sp.]
MAMPIKSRRIVLLCAFFLAILVVALIPWFRSELGWSKSGPWIVRNYDVSFRWVNGAKSVQIIDSLTYKPEPIPSLRHIVLRQSKDIVRDIVNRAGLKAADGDFHLLLQGPSEPYLISWSQADIPELDQLAQAAATWDLETVRKLISGGMNVDARALDSGNTPLILAASDPTEMFRKVPRQFRVPPNDQTFEFLLTAGANPNAKGYLGDTPLMRANDAPIVEALIRSGADVNAKNDFGWTALNDAIEDGNLKKLQILVHAHAGLNTKDKDGWTPLMYAADKGDLEATKLLLASGADPRVEGNKGETALSIARSKARHTSADKKILGLLSPRVAK